MVTGEGAAASPTYIWAEAGYTPELVVSSLQGPVWVFGVSEPEPCTTDDIIMIIIVKVVIIVIVTVVIIVLLLLFHCFILIFQHQPDLAIGVHLMDRYTFYLLEFLEDIQPASKTNMNDLVSVRTHGFTPTLTHQP